MKRNRTRFFVLFYFLVTYVFASFLWWSYLLYEKNTIALENLTEINRIQYNQQQALPADSKAYLETAEYLDLLTKYRRQNWMIIGEGGVFLLLMGFGALRLRKTFRREMMLARQQNNFLLSVTHELKSPLASIKLSLETLVKRLTMEEKFRQLMSNALEDVERLESLVDNILFAARMEGSTFAYEMREGNLSQLIEAAVNKAGSRYAKDAKIIANIEPGIMYYMDGHAIQSVIFNLIENAVKYGVEKPVSIGVVLAKKDGAIHLEMRDNGPGIPAEEREHIFKKFYRIGNEETRRAKGTGLGLFIVKSVVAAHHGTIKVADNIGGGALFSIKFPTQ